jgi:S-phase kinase-associated protein 1
MADKKEEQVVAGLDADEGSTKIKLKPKDGKEREVDRKYVNISSLCKQALEADSAATELPLPGVPGHILEYIVAYMELHKGEEPQLIPKPLRSKEMSQVCPDPRDADFINAIVDNSGMQNLYDLILAANYMDIKSLLHLGCAKVASLIRGQPLDKIKEILQKGTKSDKSGSAAAVESKAKTK